MSAAFSLGIIQKSPLRLAFAGGFLLAGRFQFSKSENRVTGLTQGIDILFTPARTALLGIGRAMITHFNHHGFSFFGVLINYNPLEQTTNHWLLVSVVQQLACQRSFVGTSASICFTFPNHFP